MGLDTVVDEIAQEAQEEADRIVSEAEDDRDAIVAEAEEEAEQIVAEAEEEAEQEAEAVREQTVSSARLEARKMASRERKALLDDLRDRVEDRLAELEQDREELTAELLDAAIAELDADEGTVHCAPDDEDLVADLVADRDGFELGAPAEMLGGVAVESGEGDVRADNTFDAVLEQVWNDEMKEISSRLLGDEE